MEIRTFGAVFKTAIALEQHLVRWYDIQSASQLDTAVQAVYRALSEEGEKRLKRLERVRRETVTEMILESIDNLTLSDDLAALDGIDPATLLSPAEAQTLELAVSRFYDEAAGKIGLVEAARNLRRLSNGRGSSNGMANLTSA